MCLGCLRERVIQAGHFRFGVEYAPGGVLEPGKPVLPWLLLFDPHRARAQSLHRIVQGTLRQIIVVYRQIPPGLRESSPRIGQLTCRRISLSGQTLRVGIEPVPGCPIGLTHHVFGVGELVLGIEHAPGRALELCEPVLPGALFIQPHRPRTQVCEGIVQRARRQILVVQRQTTPSLREIGLCVRQLPGRRIPLRSRAFQVGRSGWNGHGARRCGRQLMWSWFLDRQASTAQVGPHFAQSVVVCLGQPELFVAVAFVAGERLEIVREAHTGAVGIVEEATGSGEFGEFGQGRERIAQVGEGLVEAKGLGQSADVLGLGVGERVGIALAGPITLFPEELDHIAYRVARAAGAVRPIVLEQDVPVAAERVVVVVGSPRWLRRFVVHSIVASQRRDLAIARLRPAARLVG
ncbi:hypothetical protein NG2371_05290 [Nocardia gamkensis]|nr:hypothetical protein [Nocardia gamkensis]